MKIIRYQDLFVIIIFYCFIFFPLSSEGWASTYYVDYQTGSDSNNGTSMSAPFKHSPGDTNAISIARSLVLKGGDTVIFKGGIRYFGTIDLDWSGSPESAITYDGNSDGTWGIGKAIINNQNSDVYIIGFLAPSSVSYITIKNFEFVDIGGYAILPAPNGCTSPLTDPKLGVGIQIFNGGSNITIQDSLFHELGAWQNVDPLTANSINGVGISLQNVSNVIINNSEFTRMSIGVSIKANNGKITLDVTIKNSDFHNSLRWAVDIAPRAMNVTIKDIYIHNSKFHDYTEYDSGNWLGCGEKPHTDGIFVRVDFTDTTLNNINIYNNEFYDLTSSGGGTASIYVTEGPSVNIYNNTFIGTLHARTIFLNGSQMPGGSPQRVNIHNNSFYSKRTSISLKSPSTRPLNLSFISIKNNSFYDTRVGSSSYIINIEDNNSGDIDELDYNQYYSNANFIFKSLGADWTLSDIQNCTGTALCQVWEANGQYGAPNYADISYGFGSDSDKNKLHLRPDSPGIAQGLNLGDQFTFDKNNNIRGETWDIGAFEYILEAPSNLIILN